MEQTADEIRHLRGCINDLTSILAIPAMWSGQESAQIVTTLLDAMLGMLRLDFAYARLKDPLGGAPIEMVRLAQTRDLTSQLQEISEVLNGWLGHDLQKWPLLIRDSIGGRDVSIVPLRLGLRDEIGVIVAASQRPNFPGETERLLLTVAASQAAVGLQEARLLSEQKRVAKELDQRVAQRTSELAAANEKLKEEITQRRHAEEKLRQDERELRRITDAIPQTIVIQSPEGATLYANQAVLDYTGLSVEDVMTSDFLARIFHPEDIEKVREERQAALSQGIPFEIEQRALSKDGQYRWFLIRYNPFRDEHGRLVRWYSTGTDIDDRKRAEERTRNENVALREEIDRSSMFEEIVGSSPALRKVLAQVAKVALTDSTVLISGETGTGKELIARAIHKRSNRARRVFIPVNCAAIPQSLIASELFGHEKGAFTGALQRRVGRFEAANGGTIFLDEIGELPMETQIALLRVLQEREFERIGSTEPLKVDVRVVAATNRDLGYAVEAGTFRQDLFYRLNVFPIGMPPLRERVDDIPLLVEYLIGRYAKKAVKKFSAISKKTLELFETYDWPGNVRELQNVIERAVVLCDGETFSIDETWLKRAARPALGPKVPLMATVVAHEKELIEAALAKSNGRIAGPSGAAAKLGIPRQTLQSKIRSLGIDKNRFGAA
jgi:formate hydrogenlyase transcriptional activator